MQDKNFGIYHDLTINAPIEKVFVAGFRTETHSQLVVFKMHRKTRNRS